MKKLILFASLAMNVLSLRAQFLDLEEICPLEEKINVYNFASSHTASVKNPPGDYSFWYTVGDVTDLLITHFTAKSEGYWEIEVQERFLGIVISRTIIGRYQTYPGDRIINTTQTGTITAKGRSSIILEPGALIDASNSLFVTEIVDCPDPFRLPTGNDFNAENSPPSMYPNPISSGRVSFGDYKSSFQVYDSQGSLVMSGGDVDGFEVDQLKKGIYMVRMDGKVEKLIIE